MLQDKCEEADTRAPILILDNMETVNIAQVFGKLLSAIEHRGQYHAFALDGKDYSYSQHSAGVIPQRHRTQGTVSRVCP